MEQVDVLILGCGTAGQMPAYAAAKAGLRVVIVENTAPGGTCANRGCDAKKPLVHAAEALHRFRRFAGCGVAGRGELNWADLQKFKATFTDPIPDRTREDLARGGIELVEGEPSFTGNDVVKVGDRRWRFKRAAICTGRVPRPLEIPGAQHAIDSSAFLALQRLPARVTFIGGGYISLEFATVAALAGSEVTLLESGPRPLHAFDEDAVRVVVAGMGSIGVRVLPSRRTTAIRTASGVLRIHCDDPPPPPIETDMVVAAVGRMPAVAGLNLEAAGVEHTSAGVVVDRHLRTTNHRVWAGGDVADTGNPPLTPTAARDGRVLRRNLVHESQPRTHLQAEPPKITAAVFAIPTVAMGGYTEVAARARTDLGPVDVASGDASQWKLFRQLRCEHAFYKFLYAGSQATGDRRLVGVHIVGPGAEEAINLFATGLHDPAATARLAETAAAYPSFGANLLHAFRAGL